MCVLTREDIVKVCTENEEEFKNVINDPQNFKLFINPFSKECVEPASYDVRVGNEYASLTSGKSFNQKDIERDGIIINPNETIRVKALERVGVPLNCIALVTTKISLAWQGILQITSRIDPGYIGEIEIVLFNAGKKKVILRHMEKFANLVFIRIDGTADGYSKLTPIPKAASDYSPVALEDVKGDEAKKRALENVLKSGPPFDYIARLIQLLEENFNEKIEEQSRRFGLSIKSWKYAAIIFALIAAYLAGAKGLVMQLISFAAKAIF